MSDMNKVYDSDKFDSRISAGSTRHHNAFNSIGGHRNDNEDWPSSVLHRVRCNYEEKLSTRRLLALADFVEGLSRKDAYQHLHPDKRYSSTKFVLGKVPVVALAVQGRATGDWGYVHLDEKRDPVEYMLTVYGIICWAWGPKAGMKNVAMDVAEYDELRKLFEAVPVSSGQLPDVRMSHVQSMHVARAIRHYLDTRNALQAWKRAFQGDRLNGRAVLADRSVVFEPVIQAAQPKVETPKAEVQDWQQLILDDDYEGLHALSKERLEALADEAAELEKFKAHLDKQVAAWTRRLKLAESSLEG